MCIIFSWFVLVSTINNVVTICSPVLLLRADIARHIDVGGVHWQRIARLQHFKDVWERLMKTAARNESSVMSYRASKHTLVVSGEHEL